jgi:hypothetical protein
MICTVENGTRFDKNGLKFIDKIIKRVNCVTVFNGLNFEQVLGYFDSKTSSY